MKKTNLQIAITLFLLLSGITSSFAQHVPFPDDSRQRGYYDRPYKRYEAESGKCTTTGTILDASSNQTLVQSEASNQVATQLIAKDSYIRWTNDFAADGMVIRFSLPDGTNGGGTTGKVALYVDGSHVQDITLNSYWAWQYIFKSNYGDKLAENAPGEDKFARMRFDEMRVKLTKKIPAGKTFELRKVDNNTTPYTIDFVELEEIPAAVTAPPGAITYNVGTHGSIPDFIWNYSGKTLYIPAGDYNISKRIAIKSGTDGNGTKIIGAGMWHTQFHFTKDGTSHDKGIETNASNVEISGLYLTTKNERRYSDYHNDGTGTGKGLQGSFGNKSVIKDVWVEHFECGAWFASYNPDGGGNQVTSNLLVQNCRFRNNYADGVNLCKGANNNTVEHSSFRNNGDDDMASWSAGYQECYSNIYRYNTAENNWRASSIALFGGRDQKAYNCVILDAMEAGIRVNSDFNGSPFSETGYYDLYDISIYRSGTKEGAAGTSGDLWGDRNGALYVSSARTWGDKYDVKNVKFRNIDIYDSKGDAVHLQSGDKGIYNVSLENITINGINKSNAGDSDYYGVYFDDTSGGNNTYCVSYSDVASNKEQNATGNGWTKTTNCAVSVTGVTVDPTTKTITAGSTFTLTATIAPTNASNKKVTYSVYSGSEYASVDPNTGLVTGLKAGAAVIRATTADGGKYANCNVTVQPGVTIPVSSVTLANASVNVNSKIMLNPVISPTNATNKNVSYSIESGNTIIGLNTSTGELTGLKEGTAKVKVTTADGGKTATCTITVNPAPACTGPAFVVTDTPPSIDGSIDAIWNNAPTSSIASQIGVYNGGNMNGFSAQWRGMYDDDNVYILVEVKKPTAHTGFYNYYVPGQNSDFDQWWAGSDAIELLFDGNNSKTDGYDNYDDAQFIFLYDVDEIVPGNGASYRLEDVQYKFSSNPATNTYYFEASFPWANLDVTPTEGKVIGFDVAVNISKGESATGRVGYYASFTTQDHLYGNTTEFGNITLKDCAVSQNVPVTSVTIAPTSKTIKVGEIFSVTPNVLPANATNKNVIYSISSGTGVASVNAAGEVKGLTPGTAKVKVTTVDGGKAAECTVTVQPVNVTGVTINPTSKTIKVGEIFSVTSNVLPANATNKDVTYSISSGTGVASVNAAGEVKGLAPGTAKVKVTTVDGGKAAECTVTVTQPVTGVTINPTSKTIKVGDTFTITPNVAPTNASNKNVTYSISSGTGVASVNAAGEVKGLTPGTAKVKVTTVDGGKTAECTVTVEPVDVTGVTISPTSKTIYVGDAFTLTTTVAPANATNKNVTYSVISGTEYASVNENTGTVTGLAPGEATVRVTTADGNITDDCVITVQAIANPVTGVTIDPKTKTINVGETFALTATVAPTNATNKNISYSVVSGTEFASVDANTGIVTGLAAGQATIRVTTENGSKTDDCIVTVLQVSPPTDLQTPEGSDGKSIIAYNNTIQIDGLDVNEVVAVYNLLGSKVYSSRATQKTMLITSLREGLYIVAIEGTNIAQKVMVTK